MLKDFLARIGDNYYIYAVIICGVLAIVFYGFLNPEKKRSPYFLLPFLIVFLVLFYEVLATLMLIYKSINQKIHYLMTDDTFQGWNIWVFNIFNYQVSKLLLFGLIGINLRKSLSQKIIVSLGVIFLAYCIYTYFSEATPIYDFQPVLYFFGNTILIVASGLFFVDLVSEDYYININPLRYWPFWYITLILFQSVTLFLADVAFEYLVFENENVYFLFNYVSMILYIILLVVFNMLLYTGSNTISKLAKA